MLKRAKKPQVRKQLAPGKVAQTAQSLSFGLVPLSKPK